MALRANNDISEDHPLETWRERLADGGATSLSPDESAALSSAIGDLLDERRDRENATEAIQFLSHAGELLNASLELNPTIDGLLELAVGRFADWAQVDLFNHSGLLRTYAVQHRDPAMRRFARNMENRAHFDLEGPGGVPKVARTGEYELLGSIPPELIDQVVPDLEDRKMYRAWGANSGLIVPMRARGRVIGVLSFIYGDEGDTYTEHDVPFVQEFANRAALSLDNARMFERERHVADTLQNAALPQRLPRVPGFLFDKAYYPGATEAEVGGDWYDAFMLPDGRLAISIGDVGGKGLRAAVLMSEMRHSMRANALDDRCTPSDVLDRANRLLKLSGASLIVTAFFGFIDPVTLTLTYAAAGHPGPILAERGEAARVLPTDGVPLGVDFAEPPHTFIVQLGAGALLALYTDGLLEFDRDIIGAEQRIIAATSALREQRPRDFAVALYETVLGTAARKDDVALLMVFLDDRPTERVDVTLPASGQSAALIRRAIERFADGINLDDGTLFALQISVGEAVINAIEHAYRARDGELSVCIEPVQDAISATIRDHGAWRAILPSGESPLERERGRGFMLMDGFAEDVRVHRTGHGTTVRFVVPVARGNAPSARSFTMSP